jgi:hypothetical protein
VALPALLVLVATGVAEAGPPPALVVGARVHTRARAFDSEPYTELQLRRARLTLDLEPAPWLGAQLEAELAPEAGLLLGALRDAFIELRPLPEAELVLGQFKKPFGRIQLISEGKLPLVDRGIVNDRIIEQLGYGDRDRGAMLHGEVGPVEYALGGFNGARSSDETDPGKDAAARVELKASKAARIAVAGSMRYRNPAVDPPQDPASWAAGLDGRLRFGPVRVELDAMWAEDWLSPGRQQAGAVLWGLVELPLDETFTLAPIAKAELLDDNIERRRDLSWSFVLGANLHAGESLRLMLQAEQIASQRLSRVEPERSVQLQVAVDFEQAVGAAP